MAPAVLLDGIWHVATSGQRCYDACMPALGDWEAEMGTMETKRMRMWREPGILLMAFLGACLGAACSSGGTALFGQPCNSSDDCAEGICVGGEGGGVTPFCSEDCTGKQTGDACGDGKGKCVVDFVAWCWLPCTSDAECEAVNPARPRCATMSSSGVEYPFKVCAGASTGTDGGTENDGSSIPDTAMGAAWDFSRSSKHWSG